MEREGEGREVVVIEMKEKGRGRGVCTVNMMCIWGEEGKGWGERRGKGERGGWRGERGEGRRQEKE